MGLDDATATKLSLKRLSGKAMTSGEKGVANEALPSNVVLSAQTIFGNVVPPNPVASFYTITNGIVEYLRLSASFIAGSDTSSGRHSFSLHLPDDYEARSSNPKKGTYPFKNKQSIPITSGSLQLIPTSFGNAYEVAAYHTGSGQTQIPVLDARDWVIDCFSGIFFQQDPPGTGDQSSNPRYVDAYLYVGEFLVDSTGSGGGLGPGDPDAQYLVLSATGSLSSERVFSIGTGLSSSDSGAGGSFTLSVKDSVVATLTGSQFSGNVGVTGSIGSTAIITSPAFSGSLTHLQDGSSYLVAGNNIQIVSGSSGAITITGTSTGDITSVVAGTGLSGGGASGDVTLNIDDNIVATLTGSQFSGNVGITGSFEVGASGTGQSATFYSQDADAVGVQWIHDAYEHGVLRLGASDHGIDLQVYGETAGRYFWWDQDQDQLAISGKISQLNGNVVFNENAGNYDFRVESSNNQYMLFVDADADRLGIGSTGTNPATTVHIKDSSPTLRIQRSSNANNSTLEFAGSAGAIGNMVHLAGTNDLVFSTHDGS